MNADIFVQKTKNRSAFRRSSRLCLYPYPCTKKDILLIGRQSNIKTTLNPKNKLGPASRWCRKRGSNPHGIATTGFWVQHVCQFHHSGVYNGDIISQALKKCNSFFNIFYFPQRKPFLCLKLIGIQVWNFNGNSPFLRIDSRDTYWTVKESFIACHLR